MSRILTTEAMTSINEVGRGFAKSPLSSTEAVQVRERALHRAIHR